MSGYTLSSKFPDIDFILQWRADSQHGLCCGIFGCIAKIVIECKICNGSYCDEHKEWHMHSANNFDGIIIKDE